MYTISLIHNDIAWHDTVWVVHDQLFIVEVSTRLSIHTVAAWRWASELVVSSCERVLLPREDVTLEYCPVNVDSLSVVMAL